MNKEEFKINLKEICGEHCVGMEEGNSIYESIESKINSYLKICFDFSGVVTITSSFLNATVGKLVGKLGEEDFDKRITWNGLDDTDTQLVKLVIENAKEHYKKSDEIRKVEENIVKRIVEED